MGSLEDQLQGHEGIDSIIITQRIPDMNINDGDTRSDEDGEDGPANFPDPLITAINGIQVRFPGRWNGNHSQIATSVISCLQNEENGLIECPSDGDRRLSILTSILAYCCRNHVDLINDGEGGSSSDSDPDPRSSSQEVPILPRPAPSTKIVYATKSFEEIEEVIKELKKFKKTGYLNFVKMAVLAPPDKLCEKYASGDHSSSCTLLSSTGNQIDFSFIDSTNGNVQSIRALQNTARRAQFCPYHFCNNAEMINQANIIICPQDFVLSPFLRDNNGLKHIFKKSIVIFDDGNNVELSCYEHGSLFISTVMMQAAADNLRAILTAINDEAHQDEQMSSELRTVLDSMEFLTTHLTSFSERVRTDYLSTPRMPIELQCLRDNGLGQNECHLYLSHFQTFFQFVEENQNRNVVMESKTVTNISKLLGILRIIYDPNTGDKDFSFEVSHFQPNTNTEAIIVFKIICSNARIILAPIMNEASSLIIGSAALPPITVLRHELGPEADNFSDDVIIPDQTRTNCFFAYCGIGPHGVQFDFAMKDRERSTVQEETGEAILEICDAVPNGGIIVLFGSREALKNILSCWDNQENREQSIMQEIRETRHVFSELDFTDGDIPREMEKFAKLSLLPIGNRKGAIFFALHRGKVNKTMNFKNGEVRMIVSCGLPYDAFGASHVVAKRNYHQALYPGDNMTLAKKWSSLWYNAEMFNIIIQSWTNPVRNGQDWMGGIILDHRIYGKEKEFDTYTFIPKWIAKDLKGYRDYPKLMGELKDFVEGQGN